ncbi:MAG: hypothetical protein NTX49_07940 [Chlamydiae bacterium]|nr:hypothetical protein [Chlamydiota bacterium]
MSAVEASPVAGNLIFYPEVMLKKIARIAKITGKVEGITKIYLENSRLFLSAVVNARDIVFTLRSDLNTAIGRIERLSQAFEDRPDLKETYSYKYFESFKKMILPLIQHSSLSSLEYSYIENALNTTLDSIGALPRGIDPTDEKVRRCWIVGVSQFSSIKESFDSRQLQLSRELLSLVMQKVEAFREGIGPHLLDPLSSSAFDLKLPDFSSCAIIEQSPTPDDYLRDDLSLGLFPLLVNIGLVQVIINHMAEHEILVPSSLQSEDSVLLFALQQVKDMEEKLGRVEHLLKDGADPLLEAQVASFKERFHKLSSSPMVEYFTQEALLHTLDKKAAVLHQSIVDKCSLKKLLDLPKANLDRAAITVSAAWAEYSLALSDLRELFENHEEDSLMEDIFQRHRELVSLDKDDIYIHVDSLQNRLQALIARENGLIESHATGKTPEAQISQLGLAYHVSYKRLMKDLENRLSDPYSEEVIRRHHWLLQSGV